MGIKVKKRFMQSKIDGKMFGSVIALTVFGYVTTAGGYLLSINSGGNESVVNYQMRQSLIMVMGFVFAILLSQIDYQVIFRMKEVVFTVLYFLALGGVAVAVGQKKGIVNGTYIVLGDSIIINYEVLVELITCIFLISMLNRKKYSSDFSYRYRAIILLLLFSGNISLIIVVSTLIIVTLAIRDVKKAGLIGIGTIVWWGSVYIFLEKIEKIPIWEKILQKQLADSIQVMGNIYMTASGGIFGLGFGNTSIQEGVFSIEQSYITSLISQQFGILGILIFLILYMIFLESRNSCGKSKYTGSFFSGGSNYNTIRSFIYF